MELTKTYLYGISDFWVTMLRDKDLVERVLDSGLEEFAQVYSDFLCATSGLSLQDVALEARADLKFIPVLLDVPVTADATEVPLPALYSKISWLGSSPLAPVVLLENGSDFVIQQTVTSSVLKFAKPFSTYGFPYGMVDVDGVTKYLYGLWATDCAIDPQVLSKVFAPLVLQTPDVSTSLFQKYIEGLFRLYTGGPTVQNMRNGLCLAFGVPVSRFDGEIVLLTGRDVQTGQYWVVTSIDMYYLPYGVPPAVAEGDVLMAGTALADIVTVDDYLTDEDWWVNMYVPADIMKLTGDDQGRVITAGSVEDEIMRKWLKTHLFLIRIKWRPEYDLGDPQGVRDVLTRARATHTYGILIVSQDLGTDVVPIEDDLVTDRRKVLLDFAGPVPYIHRDGSGNTLIRRRDAHFVRANTDAWSEVCRSRPEVETVDPPVLVPASAFLSPAPVDVSTTVSHLLPLYSCTVNEAAAKVALAGYAPPLTWPYMLAIASVSTSDPVLMTREEASLPVAGSDYYSSPLLPGKDLLEEGQASELSRSYYPSLSATTTLVFLRPVDTLDLVSVYALETGVSDDVKFPVEEMDALRYRLSSDPPGTWTDLP